MKYMPRMIEQDAEQSIVNDEEQYDLTRYSKHEAETIGNVWNYARRAYPSKYMAMGIANESQYVKYKARYVLFEMLIQAFGSSSRPYDRLAVAYAYSTQGAQSRTKAIEYFELAMPEVEEAVFSEFLHFMPLALYNKISELYEKEHEWDKAIYYLEKAQRRCDIDTPYYDTHKKELEEKRALNKPYKRRTPSASSVEFQQQLKTAASIFLGKPER